MTDKLPEDHPQAKPTRKRRSRPKSPPPMPPEVLTGGSIPCYEWPALPEHAPYAPPVYDIPDTRTFLFWPEHTITHLRYWLANQLVRLVGWVAP